MDWISKPYRVLERHVLNLYDKIPSPHLWFWPIVEVAFVGLFAISPLFINADTASLYSDSGATFADEFDQLLQNGQLMYYSLGFVASSAWLLLMSIRRPRLAMLLIFGAIVYSTIRISTSIGVDPNAENLNVKAFEQASYTVFVVSLLIYLICNMLSAWQERLRPTFDADADRFAKNYEHPES